MSARRFIFKPPRIIQKLFSDYTWRFSVKENAVFLTFDDGPHPKITPFILDELIKYNWKATFFCVGSNMLKYPELVKRILNEGHSIGNHTFEHQKGTQTNTQDYLNSIQKSDAIFETDLFRPPYGRLKKSQREGILSMGKKIIFWSWISWDFNQKIPVARIIKEAENILPGDILLLHDNPKFEERIKKIVPLLFEKIYAKGFISKKICSTN